MWPGHDTRLSSSTHQLISSSYDFTSSSSYWPVSATKFLARCHLIILIPTRQRYNILAQCHFINLVPTCQLYKISRSMSPHYPRIDLLALQSKHLRIEVLRMSLSRCRSSGLLEHKLTKAIYRTAPSRASGGSTRREASNTTKESHW